MVLDHGYPGAVPSPGTSTTIHGLKEYPWETVTGPFHSVDPWYPLPTNLIKFLPRLVQKGASANMLKIGTKRRRTMAQVKLDKERESLRLQDIDEKLARLANVEQKLAHYD